MTVRRCRVHLAITDGRQCLDAEEEGIRKAVRPSPRYRTGDQPKKCREGDVHREVKCEQGGKELRPGQCNCEVVGIAEIEARNALLFELVGTEANPRYSWPVSNSTGMPGSHRRL